MKLQAPRQVTFLIALILVILGLVGQVGDVAGLSQYAFWLVLIGYVILALGTLLKGL